MAEWITKVDLKLVKSSKQSAPLASGIIVVADAIAIKIAVFGKNDGFRVALPSNRNPNFNEAEPPSKENKPYFDEVFPLSLELRREMEDQVITAYRELAENGGTPAAAATGPSLKDKPKGEVNGKAVPWAL